MSGVAGKGIHDVGGDPAPACDPDDHPHEYWERRVDALMVLLSGAARSPDVAAASRAGAALLRVDQIRRQIEALGSRAYGEMSYYERWSHAIAGVLLESGVITTAELARCMEPRAAAPGGSAGAGS